MDLGIKGRTALVTGGARGIGAAITRTLALEGVRVIFTSRSQTTIDNFLRESENEQFVYTPVGLVNSLLERDLVFVKRYLEENDLHVDILVNNAGDTLQVTDPFCGSDAWLRVLGLNTLIPIALVEMFAPEMIKRNWGRIVNITSCAGLENSGPVTFSTSKAALTAYTRSMGRVLATMADGVVMSAVFPGVVATKGGHWDLILETDRERADRYLDARCPTGRFGSENEIANVVAFYSSELASFSHGAIVPVDGGQSRHFMYHNFLD